MALRPQPWDSPAEWHFEIRNILDEPVGTARCSLTPEAEVYILDCVINQRAFEARKGINYYKSGAYELRQTVRWDRNNLALLSVQGSQVGDSVDLTWETQPTENGLLLRTHQKGQKAEELLLPANPLFETEWPWRLQALPFNLGYSRKADLTWPQHWSEAAHESKPLLEPQYLVVRTAEPIWTPAGRFIAWAVTLGDEKAWYDSKFPHRLLRYDDGMVSYLLSR
jgi:hypothetical protein